MAQPPPTTIQTVLLVEDEVIARIMLAEYLRDCGYKVIEAADTDEALVVLQHAEIGVQVVLCGISKTGTAGGFALSHWVRSTRPETEIILAGNHARATDAAGQLCEGGPTLSKPYEPQVVLDRIKRLLAARPNGE
jgi:CheY-like chemotaxis protein